MRILLDLQGCQLTDKKSCSGAYSRKLMKALLQRGNGHDFWLAMNNRLPNISRLRQEFELYIAWNRMLVFDIPGPVALRDQNNRWRNRAAKLIRQAFIEHVSPDIVFLSNPLSGFDDDAVTAIADQQTAHTIVALFDFIPLLEEKLIRRRQKAWRRERIETLHKAKMILVKSETDHQTAVTRFGLDSERIISIPAAHDCEQIAKEAVTYSALASENTQPAPEANASKKERKRGWDAIADRLLETFEVMAPEKTSGSTLSTRLDASSPPNHGIRQSLYAALREIREPLGPTLADLTALSSCIAANEAISSTPQLFVDVSAIREVDLATGIQRVVKNILRCLNEQEEKNLTVCPVYICKDRNELCYTDCCAYDLDQIEIHNDDPIVFHSNDIFVGLDLSSDTAHLGERKIREMHDKGVRIYFVIYDILPIHFPHFFPDGVGQSFTRWLRLVAELADGMICISKTVADELLRWLARNRISRDDCQLKIGYFHLGSDIVDYAPTPSVAPELRDALEAIAQAPSLLMVGTIEPRKSHALVLAAFDLLWRRGIAANLVIAGKQGWNVEALVKTLRMHPELGKRLFWFEQPGDDTLIKLYETATGLLVASEGEGFGLPLVEAAHRNIPVIARDIPVFREIGGENVCYFSGTEPEDLADAIQNWLAQWENGEIPKPGNIPCLTWSESAAQFSDVIFNEQWLYVWPPAPANDIGNSDIKTGTVRSEPLPADAGSIRPVPFKILKYEFVCDVATRRTKVSTRPEMPAPVALLEDRKFLLQPPR